MSVDRIRKLLKVAEDQVGTPEGHTAARLAQRMIERQATALSGLDEEARAHADPFTRFEVLLGGPAHWRCRLISLVAEHCACVAGYRPGTGKASLYGRRSSTQVAEHLYQVLSRSLTRERVAFSMGGAERLPEAERARRVNDFTQSAILALRTRLESMREVDAAERPEVAALVRTHVGGVDEWMRGAGHALRRAAPFPYAYSEAGYKAGYRLPLQGAVETEGSG